jgi:tetratricopeptide (TPR) repeat protein
MDLVTLLKQAGKFEEAMSYEKKAIAANFSSYIAHNSLGESLCSLKRYKEAL